MNYFQNLLLRCRRNFQAPAGLPRRRLLVIHPSGRHSSSGPYLQAFAEALMMLGHPVLMMGERADFIQENHIAWIPFRQKDGRLTPRSRQTIASFSPEAVLLVGVRSRSMLAALETVWRHKIPLLLQAEDDDLLTFMRHYPKPDQALLDLLDTPEPGPAQLDAFMARLDWPLTARIWRGEENYRLIEPVLRALALHQASAFGAIWHPMAEMLQARYAKPIIIIPPVVSECEFTHRSDRARELARNGISSAHPVIFVSGATYDYSNEFEVFLEALNHLHARGNFSLVLTSKTRLPLKQLLRERLHPGIEHHVLDLADPEKYAALLSACDIVAVPGLPDEFNRLRLPGRIPRAMARGRPVFTFATGFGTSLQDNHDAVLTQSGNAEEWAQRLEVLLDETNRLRIGANGHAFARANFSALRVAQRFSELLDTHAKQPHPLPSALSPLSAALSKHLGLD